MLTIRWVSLHVFFAVVEFWPHIGSPRSTLLYAPFDDGRYRGPIKTMRHISAAWQI